MRCVNLQGTVYFIVLTRNKVDGMGVFINFA